MSKLDKRKEYEKTMEKIDKLEDKFILIQLYAGFGNKIFDCIIALYLKYKYGYSIYYVDTESVHTKINDPNMAQIFPKLTDEFIFINNNQGDYIKYFLKYSLLNINANKLSDLNRYFNNNKQIRLRTTSIYNLVFDMFDTFDTNKKNVFQINKSLIDKNILTYAGTNYATIHIRYGDKLKLGIKKDQNDMDFITFPIYTPEYYYEQIKILKKLKLPIIILTDSVDTIKHFILKKYNLLNDPDIFIPDIPFIDSFYLLLYSSYIVMSHSTFSYSAYLLSRDNFLNKPRVYTFCTTDEFFTIYKPVDLFISNDWKIYKDKKFILNFNQKLIKEMFDFNQKN